MNLNLGRLTPVAAAGALMLFVAALEGPVVDSALAREALASRPQLNSAVTLQNLGSSQAVVSLNFVDASGNLVLANPYTVNVGAGQQQTVPIDERISGLPNGVFSVVVDSTEDIAAIVNLQAAADAGGVNSDPFRLATYVGVKDGDTAATLFSPQVMRYQGVDGTTGRAFNWNSTVSVQNAGSADAVVTISYKDRNGNPIAADATADTKTVKAGATYSFRQADRAALGTAFIGSAVVTSSTAGAKLAAVTQLNNLFSAGEDAQFLSYGARARGGRKLFVPRLSNNYYGYSSGLTMQNLGTGVATVRLRFSFPGVTLPVQTVTIQPQAASALYIPDVAAAYGIPSGPAQGKGSVTIESDQDITAIVNEDNRVTDGQIGRGDTYNAFVDGTQTTTVSLPQVTALSFGYASGMTVFNPGTTAVTGNIRLTNRGGESKDFGFTIDPSSSRVFFAPDIWVDSAGNYRLDFNGSATITASGPILVIHDMSCRTDLDTRCQNRFGDSFSMYTGVNR